MVPMLMVPFNLYEAFGVVSPFIYIHIVIGYKPIANCIEFSTFEILQMYFIKYFLIGVHYRS